MLGLASGLGLSVALRKGYDQWQGKVKFRVLVTAVWVTFRLTDNV